MSAEENNNRACNEKFWVPVVNVRFRRKHKETLNKYSKTKHFWNKEKGKFLEMHVRITCCDRNSSDGMTSSL